MTPIELLRIALGSDIAGKISLSEIECKEQYSFAQKQSIVGVLFDGIERIYNHQLGQSNDIPTISKMLLLEWIGSREIIRKQNQILNERAK